MRPSRHPNFVFETWEKIEAGEPDPMSYSLVILNQKHTNRCPIGTLSEVKRLGLRVAPDNYLLQIEKYVLDQGAFRRLPDNRQPQKKFVLVQRGKTTRVQVRYTDYSRRYHLEVSRGRP